MGALGKTLSGLDKNFLETAPKNAGLYGRRAMGGAAIGGLVGGIREKSEGGSFGGGMVSGAITGAGIGAGYAAVKFAALGEKAVVGAGKMATMREAGSGVKSMYKGAKTAATGERFQSMMSGLHNSSNAMQDYRKAINWGRSQGMNRESMSTIRDKVLKPADRARLFNNTKAAQQSVNAANTTVANAAVTGGSGAGHAIPSGQVVINNYYNK